MAANWQKIKAEYVTGSMSYRALAKKHRVPFRTLADRAKAESWVDLRTRHRDKTVTRAVEAVGDKQVMNLARINTISDALLDKLEAAVGELDFKTTEVIHREGDKENYTQTKELIAAPGGVVNQKALRDLAASLKDLKEVKGIQSELARQEQEARIAELRRKAAADDDKTSGVIVELEGGAEDYAQ